MLSPFGYLLVYGISFRYFSSPLILLQLVFPGHLGFLHSRELIGIRTSSVMPLPSSGAFCILGCYCTPTVFGTSAFSLYKGTYLVIWDQIFLLPPWSNRHLLYFMILDHVNASVLSWHPYCRLSRRPGQGSVFWTLAFRALQKVLTSSVRWALRDVQCGKAVKLKSLLKKSTSCAPFPACQELFYPLFVFPSLVDSWFSPSSNLVCQNVDLGQDISKLQLGILEPGLGTRCSPSSYRPRSSSCDSAVS